MIKNVIFDLGGVLIGIDYMRPVAAFRKLGAANPERIYDGKSVVAPFFDEFEKGAISEAQFRNKLRQELDIAATDQELDDAWNSMILGIPEERLVFIRTLQMQYNTFLFSNTNTIHLRAVKKACEANGGFATFQACFTQDYYSCDIGARKPDVDAFTHVLNDAGLKPAETLFIDDNLENVNGSVRAEMKGFHCPKGTNFAEILDFINVLNIQDEQSNQRRCCTIM